MGFDIEPFPSQHSRTSGRDIDDAVASIRVRGLLLVIALWPFVGSGQNGIGQRGMARLPRRRGQHALLAARSDHRDNVKNLQVAWTWKFDNFGTPAETVTTETTPLMVNGVLYFTAGQRRTVVAANAGTGETLWTWRPDEGARFDAAPRKVHRGVAYWTDGKRRAHRRSSRPASSSCRSMRRPASPVAGFGENGIVDLFKQLDLDSAARSDRPHRQQLAAGHLERRDRRRAGVDAGRARQQGRTSRATSWPSTCAPARSSGRSTPFRARVSRATRRGWAARREYTGNAGVWGPFSADPQLGYVYLNDRVGDQRRLRRSSSRQQPVSPTRSSASTSRPAR